MIGSQFKRILIWVKKTCFILRERISQMLSANVGCCTNSMIKRYEILQNYASPCNGLIISEGKFHQVRKMTTAVGFPTLRLVRVRIGNIYLDSNAGQVFEVEDLITASIK